jgi:hypothetical protein
MKISKKQWILIAIVVAIAVWYFFLRKKEVKKESGYSAREESAWGIKECKMLGPGVVAASNDFPCHLPGKKKLAWQSTY